MSMFTLRPFRRGCFISSGNLWLILDRIVCIPANDSSLHPKWNLGQEDNPEDDERRTSEDRYGSKIDIY